MSQAMTRGGLHANALSFPAAAPSGARRVFAARGGLVAVVLVALLAVASTVRAIDRATPMPDYTGAPVVVAGVKADYDDVADFLRSIDAGSPQSYYVVVIESAGPGEWATLDYIDALAPKWIQQSRSRGPAFDVERSVLIVLALQNRRVAVRPGTLLQTKYGLQGDRIDRELVQPYFIPSARAGDFATGLKTLVAEIDEWVTARDEAARREETLATQRREEMVRDLDAILQSFPAAAESVEREAAAKRAIGAPAERFEAPLARARRSFEEAQAKRSEDPAAALRAAQAAQSGLQQVQTDVNRWALSQADALQRIAATEPRVAGLDEALLAQARQGIAVDPLRKLIDESRGLIDAARQAARTDPGEAQRLIGDVERKLGSADALVKNLPERRRAAIELRDRAKKSSGEFERAIADAERRGVDPVEARRDLEGLRAAILSADEALPHDYDRAESFYRSALDHVSIAQTHLASETASHVFWSRDLPLLAIGLTTALVAGVLLWRWRRHVSKKRAAAEKFAAFKARVMELSESIDQLRERHRLLPASDPDFTSPPEGETLKVYNDVQSDLDRLRERWLELMDVWEKSQKLIAQDGPFSDAHLQKALDSLALAGDLQTETDVLKQRVVDPLDKLNRAHEDATADARQLEAALDEAQPLVATFAQTGRSPAVYTRELDELRALLEKARPLLVGDPLGVSKAVADLRTTLAAQRERLTDAARLATEANQLLGEADAVAATVAEQRAAGETLDEDGANPDAWLSEARGKQQAANAALDGAELAPARDALAAGRAALERAKRSVSDYAAAKEFTLRELPAATERRRQLDDLLANAEEHRDLLAKEFLPGLWRDAEEMLAKARTNLAAATDRSAEAARAAERSRPRYLLARRTIEALQTIFHDVQSLLTGVGVLLARLRQLRTACQERAETLRTQRSNVERYFDEHDAVVRSAARAALAQAVRADEEARRESSERLPDWTRVAPAWAEVETLLSQAQDLAEADVAQHADAERLAAALATHSARVGRLLESTSADRPRANQRYQTALRLVQSAEARLGERQGDWKRLLDDLLEAQDGLAKAEQWAQEDVRLAQQAAAEIDEAEIAMRRVQSFYRQGVRADHSAAQRLLDDARRARGAQEYERAVQLADEAERAARNAESAAHREAEERERRRERERQLREAAAAAAVLASAGSMRDAMAGTFSHRGMGHGGFGGGFGPGGGSSHGGGFGSSGPSSGSSQSRIPSGSSQSGW